MYVFAYGSLLWNPGFEAVSATPARLDGWRRRWCLASRVHRGTHEYPGLVLGLVEGGSCAGIVYEVRDGEADRVRRYLHQREMAEDGYVAAVVEADCAAGRITALTYVADPLRTEAPCPDQMIARLRTARGRSGSNIEYVTRTLRALQALPDGLSHAEDSGFCATNLSTLMKSEGIRHENASVEQADHV